MSKLQTPTLNNWFCGLVLGFLILIAADATSVLGAEFTQEIERDFPVRAFGRLQITNLRGSITLQGWSQDRIRVKAVRRVQADTQELANSLFSAADFRYRPLNGEIELSVEYGRGLEIQERLKERASPKTVMDITLSAPANLPLRIWGVDQAVSIRGWNAPVEVRTSTGAVHVKEVRARQVSVLCPNCAMTLEEIQGSLRCMGGEGEIKLSEISGKQIYLESGAGAVHIKQSSGDHLLTSKTGNISGSEIRGRVEFSTNSGEIKFEGHSGFVSGKTETGDISIKAREWVFEDKSLLESQKGNIKVSLPATFSADVDLWSVLGKVSTDFVVKSSESTQRQFGPESPNRIRGQIGEHGDDQLRIFSRSGNVEVTRNH